MVILTYIGSKKRIHSLVSPLVTPDNFYIEPFAGGFSLGLELIKQGKIKSGVLNDLNEDVYNFWLNVKNRPFELVMAIDEIHYAFLNVHTDEELQHFNNELLPFKAGDSSLVKAAKFRMQKKFARGFVARNITSGEVEYKNSVPDYGVKHNSITKEFMEVSKMLQGFEITNKSYQDLKDYDSSSAFWYLDPPYFGANNQNFYEICTKEDIFDHEALSKFCATLQGECLQSNFDTEYLRSLYDTRDGFTVSGLFVPSANANGRTDEVLISNRGRIFEDISLFKHRLPPE